MRLHTNKVSTPNELYALIPPGVYAEISTHGSRKRTYAYEVSLNVFEKDQLHRRFGNSGGYGNSEDVAATWDEWGIMMAAIYAIDPEAIIGWYADHADFIAQTIKQREYVQRSNKPTSLAYRTHTAPWLSVLSRNNLTPSEVRDWIAS